MGERRHIYVIHCLGAKISVKRGGMKKAMSESLTSEVVGNYKRPKSKFAVWSIGVVLRG